MSRYREQYDRMKRRYVRLSDRRAELSVSEESLMDDAQAFFECCLHLQDWIKNDEELPDAVRRAARPYVKASVLRLCRYIALAAKHLTVDTPLPKDEKPRLRPTRTMEERPAVSFYDDDNNDNDYNYLPPLTPVQVISVQLMVETDNGEPVDALALATDCVKAWEIFFGQHGLT